jgi:serine phosphatase RsbU (regulator of sigma subunit)/PAS domain-containing protein
MTMSEHATHHFEPEASSPGAARRFVRQTLTAWGAQSVIDDAVLLTNELVTNAVVHAGTALSVSCALGPDYVQIGVSDSHAFRALPPVVANAPAEKTSGRGLYLLSQIARSWGVEYEQATKRVWFRLALAASAEEPSIARQPAHCIDLGAATAPVRVAVVETDLSGYVRHWSGEAEQLLGWPADKVLERPLADLVAALPDAGEGGFAELLTRPRWCGEYLMRTADGDERAVFASHVHAAAGEGSRVVCLMVPAEHRAVLMPSTAAGAVPEQTRAEPEPVSPVPSRPGLLPLDSLLELAVGHSRDLLDGDVAYALLVTDDDLDVELRATTGLDRSPAPVTRWRKPAELAGGSDAVPPQVYADLTGQSIPERFLAEAGMRALVTAPLRVGDRVVGRVGVAAQRPGAFDDDEAQRLQRSVDRFSLAIESARLNEVERARRGRLSFLAEASDLLAGMLDPDMAAALAAQLVVPRLADWCAVYLVDQRRRGRLSCVWHAQEERIDALRRLLLQVRPPVMETSGRPQQWPALREALEAGGAEPDDVELAGGPTVTVTLLARGRAIGTLAAGLGAGQEFRTGSLDTLDDLGRRAAWALDNARLYRERSAISQALQRSLLPAALPAVPGLDVGIAYEAAGEGIEVGGDFYDVFAVGPGRWGFVIGDVCGKGAEAAAVAGLARHSLRVLAREHRNVPAVLRRLNTTILAEGEATRFVTLIYGELVPEQDGGITITFAAAGHPPPFLVGADGTVEVVGRPQPLLGVFPEPAFRSDTVRVSRGQHLVCTTDGVTDRRVGNRTLGDPGLRNLLRQTPGLPAAAVATRIHSTVLEFGPEPLQDDFAVLVLQPGGPSVASDEGRGPTELADLRE